MSRPAILPQAGSPTVRSAAWLAAVGVALSGLLIVIAALAAGGGIGSSFVNGPGDVTAVPGIPMRILSLYREAAARYGLDWAILAGIGKVECDHGRDPDPSCSTPGAVNAAGAGGPMQFLASTWSEFGVDGDGDGRRDRWDPADAIFGAANYLRASGAPASYARAILAYNHSRAYLAEVEAWAARYEAAADEDSSTVPVSPISAGSAVGQMQSETPTPIRLTPGETARLAPGDGHLALVPAAAPEVVQAMVIAGNELQDLPYGPAGHPNPAGASQEDCSSTINYILYRAGLRSLAEIVRLNPLAQDYVDWGAPGPGRWVTIYATDVPTPHVFATIAGLRIDTSHDGTDVGPNRDQDGPRWRLLDGIPTWAHWSVRHPPGL